MIVLVAKSRMFLLLNSLLVMSYSDPYPLFFHAINWIGRGMLTRVLFLKVGLIAPLAKIPRLLLAELGATSLMVLFSMTELLQFMTRIASLRIFSIELFRMIIWSWNLPPEYLCVPIARSKL